jgi:hypothetical protein
MMNSTIQVVGIPELQKALKKAQDETVEIFKKQLQASGLELETEAKKELSNVNGVDTGQARAETRSRSTDGGLGVEIYSPNPTAAAIEFGTAPAGQLKQHMPPPKALEGWVRRHGMAESAAYLVARKIALQGIKARPWMSKAHDTVAPKFVKDLTAALNKLLGSL